MFPESSSSLEPPWVAGSTPADPQGPIRPRLATTMAEDAVCSWNGCYMTWGWQLRKGDVELGNEHGFWEAPEAHPVLTPGIQTAGVCRAQAPPTKAGPESELSPHLGVGGAGVGLEQVRPW